MTVRLFFALILLAAALPAEEVWKNVERIVAVGDVHGDYSQFVTLLREAGVIDDKEKWIAGRTHFVQTGDVHDRGPDTRKIIDLIQDLEKQAHKAGGYVHPLIGNHESMNMYGDVKDVTKEEFAAFATRNSQRLLERAYELHVERERRETPEEDRPEFNFAYQQKWMEEHPPGFVEHQQAHLPDGEYGKWIRKNNSVIQINDTIFLHGGWSPKYADWTMEDLNKRIQEELSDFSKLRDGVTIDPEGPLWYRGLAQGDQAPLTAHVDALLEKLGAKRIVIGHTPTIGTVFPRFGGKVLLIDVGLSQYYGGRRACLVIENGVAATIHRGKRLALPEDGSAAALHRYLSEAAALDPAPSPLQSVVDSLAAQVQ